MYFFFHLLTGLILGLLIGDLLHDRRWVLPCAIGAILPDLFDKPLGMLIFNESIRDGRIFGHTVLMVVILGVIGLLVMNYWKTPVIAGIVVGVISHQVLDSMWWEPKNWLYPAHGAFPRLNDSINLTSLLESELKNPVEIILFISVCVGIGLFVYRDRIVSALARHTGWVRGLLACGAIGLGILSCVFFWFSRGKHFLLYLAWTRPEEFVIGSIVTALAALLLWRWYRKVLDMG